MTKLQLGCSLQIPTVRRRRFDEQAIKGVGAITDTHHPVIQSTIAHTYHFQAGRRLRIAFYEGDSELRHDIARWAKEWEQVANIKFEFYVDDTESIFYEWTPDDVVKQGDIRISFQSTPENYGFWSAIGNDIERESEDEGEHYPANIPTMNYEDLRSRTIEKQRALVLHEFGHAIGFLHEHQSPAGNCDSEFRWDDEAGYDPGPLDETEGYGIDANGRSPGIYRVMMNQPYEWSRPDIDDNFRTLPDSYAHPRGGFDPLSIMKYFYEPWMYIKGEQSHCYSGQDNMELSVGDIAAAKEIYPFDTPSIQALAERRRISVEKLIKNNELSAMVQEKLLDSCK